MFLAMALPSGLEAEDEIQLKGRSEFQFKDGKILDMEISKIIRIFFQ